jgi:hypothetical protein
VSVYTYTQSKVIDKVTFKKTANGAIRAYLHASPEINPERVEEILKLVKAADMEAIPYTFDGKPALEIRGFKREAELLTLLDKHDCIDEKPQIQLDKEDKISWMDMMRKRSLQLSGASMMVADVGFAMYGAKGKSWEDTLAGLSYLSGSAVLTAYGRNDQSALQIRDMATLMLDHARSKGYDIPDDTALSTVGGARKDTVFRKLDNFFRQHPSEIGNMMYVAAGGLIAKSALQHRALATPRADMTAKQIGEMRKGGWGDTALGTTTVASGLLATFVKEKAKDPDAPKKHGLAGIGEWIQESPLRLASYGYIGSTLCHAYTTFVERKEALRALKDTTLSVTEHAHATAHLKAIPWRVLFVSATLVGEFLLSISSKGHGEGVVSDNSVDESVVAIAAELVLKQPKEMQEQLIENMGKFLGRPEILALKDEEAIKRLRVQVEEMRENPWAKSSSALASAPQPVKVAAPAIAEPKAAEPKGKLPAWQAKVNAMETSAPQSPNPA